MENDQVSILIVDDETDLLEMYRELFEMEGFQVYTATCPMLALDVYERHPEIKLIISDANMGEMSGLDLLTTLKKNSASIPIFYLATGAIEQTEQGIKDLGGDGVILKPFDLDGIILRIKRDLKL